MTHYIVFVVEEVLVETIAIPHEDLAARTLVEELRPWETEGA